MTSLSIVIPVYNSAASLEQLVSRLEKTILQLTGEYEIILVNDGSLDNSWLVIDELAKSFDHVGGIDLMRNFGQHNALLCGIQAAQYDLIVTMDDDLQHPPEEIPQLLDKLAEGYDLVYGIPRQPQHDLWRNLTSGAIKLILQIITGSRAMRHVSALRVFRTQLRDAFANYQSSFTAIDVLLSWGTTRIGAIPVEHQPRQIGVSAYNFGKLLSVAINMITGFSTIPLQMASWTGFTFMLFGIGVLIYVLGRYMIQGYSVPGFPFLASIIAVFSGSQLFALGIIGEYLARIHSRVMERPTYVVRQQIGRETRTDRRP